MLAEIKTTSSKGRRDLALIKVLFSSGLRISEALALQVHPFDDWKQGTLEISIVGKGGYQRVVFITADAVQAVRKYLDGRDLRNGDDMERVFNITPRMAQIMVKKRADWAGLGTRMTPHKLRHSMATHVLRKGANIRIVQELLGHSSLSSTMVYTGVTNNDLKEAHKKFMQ